MPSVNLAVVTGAAGFIGSHLADVLTERGHPVVGLDSLDDWYSPARKAENLAAARSRRSFRLALADIRTADLPARFAGARVVYHLAARPGVQDSWGPGFATACEINVVGTQAVLEAALKAGVGRVVLASSSSVYGESAGPDGTREVAPVSPYGASKAACEHLADVYSRRGLEVVTLRYFTVFGPRQRPDMAIHRIFEAARPGGPAFARRGDGNQTREFTFVRDVAEATAAAGAAPQAAGCTLDIGGGFQASVNDLIAAVSDITGRAVRTTSAPRPAGDPAATVADGDPARRLLGWRPGTKLSQGLVQQWAWHRSLAEPPSRLSRESRLAAQASALRRPVAARLAAAT